MNENKELKSYLYLLARKYKTYLFSLSLIASCAGLFSVFVNYKIKEIIDVITKDSDAKIVSLVLLFALYKLMFHGFYFIGRLFHLKYQPKLLAEILEDAYTKTMKHSLHWFDSHLSGEIASKITDFQANILGIILIVYRSWAHLITIIVGIIFLFTINYIAATVMVSFVLIYTPILSLLVKKQLQIQEEYTKARQESVGIINDSISNIFGIKIIGNLWTELKLKLIPSINNWASLDKKSRHYDAYYVDMADTILVTIMSAAQIGLIAYLYKSGQITAGDFAFIAMITMGINKELEYLLENILFTINPNIATIKSSYLFINSSAEAVESADAKFLPRIKGDIKYENVTFSYGDGGNIFENLNLHIKRGQRVGIVGTSGAGKTTLIKCLLRYFNIKSGRILIDDFDIADVTEESLRANISVIPQDITMFHRSILENLQLAKYDATLEEIKLACKKARIDADIEKMSHGYNSIVGERGVKLSGGQRQRIAIARAILKNAPILILDEATSALDTPTENLIQQSLNEILDTTNSTTIVIAHRLSTLLHMNRILVFDGGKIIEDGTHEELLIKNGLYKKLWDAQAGGFLAENLE
jgi:ATP-binding cassette subfamily B protein